MIQPLDHSQSPRPEGETARLAVTRLMLTNFRSYNSADISVSARPVVLAGPNGAGKTNLLDAISLLSPGRGLRGATLSEHTRRGPAMPGEALWAVAASVSHDGDIFEIGTGLVLNVNGNERRQVRLNGASAGNAGTLADIVQMAWLTPSMDRLFIEGALGRRRFLDRLVLGFESMHARITARYEQAMRERARLLANGPRDPSWLDGLEKEMAETGVALVQARASVVEQLNLVLAERGEAGAFPAAQLALIGDADILVREKGEAAADAMREKLERARIRDAEAGRATFGPHRSDLAVRHTAKRAPARECSTGEQKALLVSIVLAEARALSKIRNGRAPLLLLDEIAAHLDSERRAALFDEILELGAQAWMTGTDIEMFAPLRGRADMFEVADSQPRKIAEAA